MADEFPGGGGGFGAGFVGWLIGLFTSIKDSAIAVYFWARSVFKKLADSLADFAVDVSKRFLQAGKWLLTLGRLLKRFWDDILRPLLRLIWIWIRFLWDELRIFIGGALRILRAWADAIRALYNIWVRPILDLIDFARVALHGLAALGVDWAKELDKKLGDIEDKINAPFLEITKVINQISDLLDRILTLDGLLTRLLWLRTLAGYRKLTIQFWWNSQRPTINEAQVDKIKKTGEPPTMPQVQQDTLDILTGSGGNLEPQVTELETQMRIWLASAR